MTYGCFITGTDTEVGKTLVASALIHCLRKQGNTAIGMKPIAAGAREERGELVNDDVEALVAVSSVEADRKLINPYLFRDPVAPHIAAADEGRAIDIEHIVACYQQLESLADAVVVEGVGGFCVPLGRGFDTTDLAQRLSLPVILVVGMRLGCINHALLSAEAIRARGLQCIGWVANHVDPDMQRQAENIAALDRLLDMPRIGSVGYLIPPDPAAAAACIVLPPELSGDAAGT